MKPSRLATFFSIIAVLMVLPWAAAQQDNPSGNTGSGTGSTGNSTPKTPVIVPTIPQAPTRPPEYQKIPDLIFISGSVIQEDGTPPPFGTEIEVDCGDTVTREATTSSDGHYGFQIGSVNRIGRVMPDASDPFGQDPFDASAAAGGGTMASSAVASNSRTPL